MSLKSFEKPFGLESTDIKQSSETGFSLALSQGEFKVVLGGVVGVDPGHS